MAALSDSNIELRDIVRINEEIKRVVWVAFKVNIMALNAIFLAKRAGSAALGFGVLSHELRMFSRDLRERMQGLSGLIHACAVEVSRMLQTRHRARLMEAAAALAPQASLQAVLARRQEQCAQHGDRLGSLRRQLKLSLEDAFRMAELGGVLAKSAKIEAAYGQSFAPALSQVSGEFDGVVEEIRVSLEALKKTAFLNGRQGMGRGA